MKDTFVIHGIFEKSENVQGETIKEILKNGVLSKAKLTGSAGLQMPAMHQYIYTSVPHNPEDIYIYIYLMI